jgi:hypothetical protein
MDRNRRKGKQPCPACEEEVYWKRYEPRNYITSLGEMRLERAYYHHGICRCGWVPLDERLELGASELSPRVQEMGSYLGAWMPFEQARIFLSKYCGIQISHDTVNNTTVAIGQALKEKQEAEVGHAWEESCLPACEVDPPPKRLYVSADGISHLLPNGQGKEIKVAAVYETEERHKKKGETEIHAIDIEYVVHTNAEELARAAYLIAVKRGVEAAEEIIVLGDGATGYGTVSRACSSREKGLTSWTSIMSRGTYGMLPRRCLVKKQRKLTYGVKSSAISSNMLVRAPSYGHYGLSHQQIA